MRRKSLTTVGVLSVTTLLAAGLTGCAADEVSSASDDASYQAAEPAAAPKPRRNRLCSGDALGEKILRSDPSLSATGSPASDRATASVPTE